MTSAEILMLILTGVMAVGTLISAAVMMSNKKQRNEVSFSFEPASKTEFEKHVSHDLQEHRDIFSKIGGVERGARRELQEAINSGNISREALHKRINELLAAISKLEGKLEDRSDS